MVSEDVLRTHLQELRRGTVVVASLVALRRPDYGYALLQRLTDHGFPVDANTLYPLLRRLEDQGLLTSEWNTEESRPRKFYRTSDEGESMLSRLLDDLAAVQTSITGLIQGVDR
ncbi:MULTISPECIES: PadR family transcriptional regulator [Micromonospora]|uniref:Helix-turn-helix transcriptional regulator n=3 Tax=Micromonospora TaxID=1873 RepID=A0A5C4Q9U6_9ACTN|nr:MULTISPECIES: PadR family transcriptional regulator [Micromonospora]WSZ80047.1 PadR family transcriptional regulator [Micromonospora sp. NBC_00860]WSZ87326.1 PadR family transcriptional regulator [Micromonospora sp. NBC_00858]MBB5480413.1 DNA-binding PadR family transcriptional regulator [Micromonospora parathelypteridis]MBQ0905678.1 helix-turn-helix transcriptional regulator [Micromonospora sp. U21]PYC68507.1 PadR family transcriptional regulator [Micromonospora arborensis]